MTRLLRPKTKLITFRKLEKTANNTAQTLQQVVNNLSKDC